MFKEKLEELANEALEISGVKAEYTDKDFVNASLVLMEVLANKMFDYYQNQELSMEEMCAAGEKMGGELREFMMKYTGVDMHVAVKE